MEWKDMLEDIMVDILARLPVKSLVRFKSLSKFYYALITNHSFITKHFHYSIKKDPFLLICRYQSAHARNPYLTLLSDEMQKATVNLGLTFLEIPEPLIALGIPFPELSQGPIALGIPFPKIAQPSIDFGQPFPEILQPPFDLSSPQISQPAIGFGILYREISQHAIGLGLPFQEGPQPPIDLGLPFPEISRPTDELELPLPNKDVVRIEFHGPCNGIFCLLGFYFDIPHQLILWNPATREIKVLPMRPQLCSGQEYCILGFGIDPKTNDYKVVSILRVTEIFYALTHQLPPAEVEVYNLSTNSWKMVGIINSGVIASQNFNSFLNGVFHWLTIDTNERVILCFDMSYEVFWKLKLPLGTEGDMNEVLVDQNIAVIDDHIACVKEYNCHLFGSRIEIWVMNEYGVEDTWNKRFNIGPLVGLGKFRGFWKEAEILAGEEGGLLFSYNLDTQQPVQMFPVNIGPVFFRAFKYMESIVPICGAKY